MLCAVLSSLCIRACCNCVFVFVFCCVFLILFCCLFLPGLSFNLILTYYKKIALRLSHAHSTPVLCSSSHLVSSSRDASSLHAVCVIFISFSRSCLLSLLSVGQYTHARISKICWFVGLRCSCCGSSSAGQKANKFFKRTARTKQSFVAAAASGVW